MAKGVLMYTKNNVLFMRFGLSCSNRLLRF